MRTLCGCLGDKAVVIGLPAEFDLDSELRRANQVFLATAFARESGWNLVEKAVLESGAAINIVTGLYCCHTEPSLLWKWLHLIPKRPGLRVSLAASRKANHQRQALFHPKVLLVFGENGRFAIVGSGNLTCGGLRSNIECSLYTEEAADVGALVQWFHDIESVPLSETAIEKYQPHYDQAASDREALEGEQEAADQDVRLEIVFRRRTEATPWLGKIREAYLPSTVENIATIREGLRFLFGEERAIEKRLPQLLDPNGKYHVHGVGRNLISKFLVAHDPKRRFVYNKQVRTSLESFGFRYSGKGGTTALYLAFAEGMRSFKDDCGAEDCVALDAFFGNWYRTQCQNAKQAN